ncbi:GNAT family N-acetyltransferase [Acrocarpospora phusangensis]|uniref:GNAT family N-acetyltransferase n=1 Tax=Acrocarpospora phusangensis TaxID=1070424 RepID=UPI00195226CF|nr:GNAT family N-acetyltransferase [Acrocarpospora phusangensis]
MELVTRPMTAGDAEAVREMHARCSPESLRSRYFGPMPRLSDRVIALFTNPAKGVTFVTHLAGGDRVVAMSNLMDVAAGEAELAFLIEDDWQGRGLGRILLRHLLNIAPGRRIHELTASVYSTNHRMLALFKAAGAILPRGAGMVVDLRMPLDGDQFHGDQLDVFEPSH